MGLCFSTTASRKINPRPEIIKEVESEESGFKVYRILPYDSANNPRPRKPHI